MGALCSANVILWGWHTEDAVLAVKDLVAEGSLEIVAWFGNAASCKYRLNSFLYQFDFISPSSRLREIEGLLSSEELMLFVDMYSRIYRSRGLTIQELVHTAYCYYYFFSDLMNQSKVDHVIFSSPPHFGVDYILYVVAQKYGVQTTISMQSLEPNRFFFVKRIEDIGLFQEAMPQNTDKSFAVAKRYEKKLFYMLNSRHRKTRPLLSLLNDFRRFILRKSSKPMSFVGVLQKCEEAYQFNRGYAELIQGEVDLTAKFVYFPLQLQPEMTTSTLGGDFSDQLKAIECVSRLIPDDWYIYVKENPYQTHRQRGAAFYCRLKAIQNVKYVSKNVNTYDLIKDSRFVATVTGTVGWESITGGKAVLTFGFAWYLSLPGVVAYRSNIKLEEITSIQIDHEKLIIAYNILMLKTHLGVIDSEYSKIVDESDLEQNIKNLRGFLRAVINGKLFVHS
jgi:hypothetical protein